MYASASSRVSEARTHRHHARTGRTYVEFCRLIARRSRSTRSCRTVLVTRFHARSSNRSSSSIVHPCPGPLPADHGFARRTGRSWPAYPRWQAPTSASAQNSARRCMIRIISHEPRHPPGTLERRVGWRVLDQPLGQGDRSAAPAGRVETAGGRGAAALDLADRRACDVLARVTMDTLAAKRGPHPSRSRPATSPHRLPSPRGVQVAPTLAESHRRIAGDCRPSVSHERLRHHLYHDAYHLPRSCMSGPCRGCRRSSSTGFPARVGVGAVTDCQPTRPGKGVPVAWAFQPRGPGFPYSPNPTPPRGIYTRGISRL